MFVATRDLRFARGRFALMGSVVALLTLMVVLLSGLTAGLGRGSTSAITGLSADHLVFSRPPAGSSLSFSGSHLDAQTITEWSAVPGVTSAQPLTIAMSRADRSGADPASDAVAVFAVHPGSHLAPAPTRAGGVVLSSGAADALHAAPGDHVTVGGRDLTVTTIAGDDSYSHADVVWIAPDDLPGTAAVTGAGPAGTSDSTGSTDSAGHTTPAATVIALTTTPEADLAAADATLHTTTVATDDAVSAIGSYPAENGSLQLMRALLLAISALVVGAFFTVWTVQRSADIAVLKALGSSTGYLLRDALGQALILLLIGTGVGTALAAGLGALAASVVPFVLGPATVLLPAAAMIALGLLGAAASLRRVTAVDPLAALGSAR